MARRTDLCLEEAIYAPWQVADDIPIVQYIKGDWNTPMEVTGQLGYVQSCRPEIVREIPGPACSIPALANDIALKDYSPAPFERDWVNAGHIPYEKLVLREMPGRTMAMNFPGAVRQYLDGTGRGCAYGPQGRDIFMESYPIKTHLYRHKYWRGYQ